MHEAIFPNPNMNEWVYLECLKHMQKCNGKLCRGDINYFSKKQTCKHTEEQHLDLKSPENKNINA